MISTAAATRLGHIEFLGTAGSMVIQQGKAHLKYFDPRKVKPLKLSKRLAAANREYASDRSMPWIEEHLPVEGRDVGGFYDSVVDTVRGGRKFPVKAAENREMMRVMALCRTQNPKFRGR